MQRFALLMERELNALGHSVKLLQPKPWLGKLLPVNRGLGKWLGYVDKFLLFPITLKRTAKNYDVVHLCDHSNAMYIRHLRTGRSAIPHVVTCHDVLAIRSALGEIPQNQVSRTGKLFQRWIFDGLKAAQLIVCDSEATRTELLRLTLRPPSSSTVVYLSLNYPYSPMPRAEAVERLDKCGFDARAPFFLHVGGAQWYKNRLGLLQIFNSLRQQAAGAKPRLLMVGKPLSDSLLEYIAGNALENAVEHLTDVSNEDLAAAYSIAEGLIFPSLQEGFGWPVLEAQACGCPVFTTGRPPMSEIGAGSAVYFEPEDAAAAAKIIAHALESRDSIRQRGSVNVLRFSVEQMIEGYTRAYEQAAHR
jgi:glycosyltransferase involved in cell wall biosynthesis